MAVRSQLAVNFDNVLDALLEISARPSGAMSWSFPSRTRVTYSGDVAVHVEVEDGEGKGVAGRAIPGFDIHGLQFGWISSLPARRPVGADLQRRLQHFPPTSATAL